MWVSVRANVRVGAAARRSAREALQVALRAGGFSALIVVGMVSPAWLPGRSVSPPCHPLCGAGRGEREQDCASELFAGWQAHVMCYSQVAASPV